MGNKNSGWRRVVKMTPRQRAQAVKSANAGIPIAELCRKYNVSRTYIYMLLNPKPLKSK